MSSPGNHRHGDALLRWARYGFGVEPTRFYPPRWRLLLLAVGCALLAAVFAIATLADAPLWRGLGWIGLVGFGLATITLLARALRPGPTVLIDGTGITDRTTLAPTGLVRWSEITVIRKKEIGRGMGAERLLEVVLSDPDAFRARPHGVVRRAIDRYRALLKQPAVSIPGSMVAVPMQQVMDAIRRWRPELQVLEGPPPAPKLKLFGRRHHQPRRQHPDLPRW
jgi:hypothetical protein